MTREETKEAIKVMQHFVDGGDVQLQNDSKNWIDITDPAWRWNISSYRIKPTPRIRPFTPVEVANYIGYQFDHGHKFFIIVAVTKDSVVLDNSESVRYEDTYFKIRKDANSEPIPFGVVEDAQ